MPRPQKPPIPNSQGWGHRQEPCPRGTPEHPGLGTRPAPSGDEESPGGGHAPQKPPQSTRAAPELSRFARPCPTNRLRNEEVVGGKTPGVSGGFVPISLPGWAAVGGRGYFGDGKINPARSLGVQVGELPPNPSAPPRGDPVRVCGVLGARGGRILAVWGMRGCISPWFCSSSVLSTRGWSRRGVWGALLRIGVPPSLLLAAPRVAAPRLLLEHRGCGVRVRLPTRLQPPFLGLCWWKVGRKRC